MTPHLIAIITASAASYVAGFLWYIVLGRRWQEAVQLYSATAPYRPRAVEMAAALIGQFVLATALSILFARLEIATSVAGLLAAAAVWLGFVLPTLATNLVFQRRSLGLLWMDGGHWLLILAIQGAVLGALG